MKQINFKINNTNWKIIMKDKETLLNKFNSENDQKALFAFGVASYTTYEIWINSDMCFEQQLRTLKHELAHCYMWVMGMYNVANYNEEFICDLISASNDFINEVVEKFKRQMS